MDVIEELESALRTESLTISGPVGRPPEPAPGRLDDACHAATEDCCRAGKASRHWNVIGQLGLA